MKRGENTYVYLYEGYREDGKVKNRNLHSFGKLSDLEKKEPGILERLKKEAEDGTLPQLSDSTLSVPIDVNEAIAFTDRNYGWKVLNDVYQNLGITAALHKNMAKTKIRYDLDEILKLLVFQRILNPSSKIATLKSQELLYGSWNVESNGIYRSLSYLNTIKNDLQLEIHNNISKDIGREASLVFYDVTNYYFESDYADEDTVDDEGNTVKSLRKLGPSKEKRRNPIVQMGLFLDKNGIPISYQLFPGNQTDPITYLPAIQQVKKQFGIERVVVVADKAMNSKNNIKETLEKGDGYLFSIKHRGRRGASKEIQAFILDNSDWQFNTELSFAKKSMIRERVLVAGTKKRQEVTVKEKVLVTWNKKYSIREKVRRDGAIEYANKLTNAELFRQTSKKGGKRYLDLFTIDEETGEKIPFSPLIRINQEEIDFDAQFDGINVITTSEVKMSDEDILKNYSELYKIEDCFKVTKSDLLGRPCYVWTDPQIEGHFLSCYIALVILRILQYTLNYQYSPEKIISALNSCRTNDLRNGYYRVQANEVMKEIHQILGIEWTKMNVKAEQLKSYAKDWYPTRLNVIKNS